MTPRSSDKYRLWVGNMSHWHCLFPSHADLWLLTQIKVALTWSQEYMEVIGSWHAMEDILGSDENDEMRWTAMKSWNHQVPKECNSFQVTFFCIARCVGVSSNFLLTSPLTELDAKQQHQNTSNRLDCNSQLTIFIFFLVSQFPRNRWKDWKELKRVSTKTEGMKEWHGMTSPQRGVGMRCIYLYVSMSQRYCDLFLNQEALRLKAARHRNQ